MSGNLARHVQDTLADRVGYVPAADLLIENSAGTRRISVELQFSRADPVANHAKFAIPSRLRPFDDTFVAMLSRHVTGDGRPATPKKGNASRR